MGEVSDYTVTVKTGDKKYAGTDAYVRIVLHDESEKKTDPIILDNFFRNDFERGQEDIFQLRKLPYFPNFSKLELWRDNSGFGASWYVDTIKLQCEKSGKIYVFPIYRWIKADYHYMFSHLNTSLPQDDKFQEQRRMEMDEKRKIYEVEQKVPGLPLQVTLSGITTAVLEPKLSYLRSVKSDINCTVLWMVGGSSLVL
ncbi:hypothetical protein KUTeg_008642 [Tegillarca granosa]|uniref:PLAT domain-containing protein n=1 Tax=Tegillarca granosa TaxID=220873 RepID=A0ABQ9FCX7_TEGGR|nr:hypothetical protein KUTeg_008642 [Tegillarca granosa]